MIGWTFGAGRETCQYKELSKMLDMEMRKALWVDIQLGQRFHPNMTGIHKANLAPALL